MTFSYTITKEPKQSLFYNHVHNTYEIIYFREGDVDYVIGSEVYHINNPDLLIICPGVPHYLRLRSCVPCGRFVINFTPEDLNIDPVWAQEHSFFHITTDSLIYRFFETWAETAKLFPHEEAAEFVRSGLSMALLLLKHQLSPKVPEQTNPTLANILTYIDENLDTTITAEQLSARFYVSTSWIVHVFRRYLGITLMQYVRKKRILHAQSLIMSGTSPTDVAAVCHFENYATFYRQYKAVLGHSPNQDKPLPL